MKQALLKSIFQKLQSKNQQAMNVGLLPYLLNGEEIHHGGYMLASCDTAGLGLHYKRDC